MDDRPPSDEKRAASEASRRADESAEGLAELLITDADFERAVRRYSPRMFIVCKAICGPDSAEDARQLAWEKASRHRGSFKPSPRGIWPWLRKVTKRAAFDVLRSTLNCERHQQLGKEPPRRSATPLELAEAKDLIMTFLDGTRPVGLSENAWRCAQIWVRAVINDEAVPSREEIARQVGCTSGSVAVFCSHCRRELEDYLRSRKAE